MMSIGDFRLWFILLIIGQVSDGLTTTQTTTTSTINTVVPYNQPKFGTYPTWNSNANNFATTSIVGNAPPDIFIDTNNSIYVINNQKNRIVIWFNNSINPTKTISTGLSNSNTIFVTNNGDIFVATGNSSGQINKLKSNSNISVLVMFVNSSCSGIFVDTANNLYCSLDKAHKVVKRWLGDNTTVLTTVAGTGSAGSASNTLNTPNQIFVTRNFDLYVADCYNNRIQFFPSGETNAITVAGSTSINTTVTLGCPTGVVLDGDNYLVIVDHNNNRIVKETPDGFRCIVGCWGGGPASNQLYGPRRMAFDSYGNLYVVDSNNNRVQKFNLLNNTLAVPYNQPKFCSSATWNTKAITFANSSTVGAYPYGIFINTNNSVYVADYYDGQIVIWFNQSIYPPKTLSGGLGGPKTIFATSTGDIYVDNGNSYYRVERWTKNASKGIPVMHVNTTCFGLFVDTTNALYCAVIGGQTVLKRWLGDNATISTVVAGTGSAGSASNELHNPCGIFVDVNFDLYVADQLNNRIQLFRLGETNGTTVAGGTSLNTTFTLNEPNGIVLDADKYLFIADYGSSRIIGSNSNGFRCLVGCSGSGSTSNKLSGPGNVVFDSYGNMYVTDIYNSRIQKFILSTNSCQTTTVIIPVTTTQIPTERITSMITSIPITTSKALLTSTVTLTSTAMMTSTEIITSILMTASNALLTSTVMSTSTAVITSTEIMTSNAMTTTKALLTNTVIPTSTTVMINAEIMTSTPLSGPTVMPTMTPMAATTDLRNNTPVATAEDMITSTRMRTSEATLTPIDIAKSTSMIISTTAITSTSMTANRTLMTTAIKETSTSMITTSKQLLSNHSYCYSPSVTLIPGTSTISSPIQFRRSQDLNIVSIIEFNCNDTFAMTTQWIINNCTTTTACSSSIQLDSTIPTRLTELYIPARILSYGTYEFKLTVKMNSSLHLSTTSSVYVRITSSDIIANLVQSGTSMITNGYEEDLLLNPGAYSVDPDGYEFNASDWKYTYYCRIYGLSMFPTFQGSLLSIDDPTIDPLNPSCLINRTDNQTLWKYNSINSSLTLLSQSLQSNRTYQFMVYMENRRNSSRQATGYVLVKVENSHPSMIVIGCVISTMCVPNLEFQLVNPTTQVALFSYCSGNCSTIQNISWNIYYGTMNSSSNVTTWILYNQTSFYQNIWFYGTNTSSFTATNQLFLANPHLNLWRFEVTYGFLSETSLSSLNFVINQSPANGSCSIDPLNGTTSTLFTIICSNWFDDHEITDYSIYAWTTDRSKQFIVGYSSNSTLSVRFPSGDEPTFDLYLIVYIRDRLDCLTEYNISSSINIKPDLIAINNLINDIQNSSRNNAFLPLLATQNQNIVGQVINLISKELNQISEQTLDRAILNGIPTASILITPLGSQSLQGTSMVSNSSSWNEEINIYANVREYLSEFITNLAITTLNSIKLQSLFLVKLTNSTNQLTRTTLTIAFDRCYQLTLALYSISSTISYEDTQITATQLLQCTTNILTAVNGPLQERINVLDIDFIRAPQLPDDYDTDLDLVWSHLNLFADGNDFSWETIAKNRNIYYQKQLANQILSKSNEIISMLTSSLNIHLNLEQYFILNSSQVFFSLETKSIEALLNKQIRQIENGQINLPSIIQTNQTIHIRSMMEPLASYGKSQLFTNLSRSISLTILDQNQNEISLQTNENYSIEILIPRDPNVPISSMILQNVTSITYQQLFYLHYVNITNSMNFSIHVQIHPLNNNVSYLLIYKFDGIPQLNTSINQIDGWTVLCSSNLTNDGIYTYFLNNQQTSNHQSFVIGLRELNSTEILDYCYNSSLTLPPLRNERSNLTSNYELRIYTSGCFYLDENNQWASDGLIVGPLTNHNQTQCFSNHLTTFAGGFLILPQPINWQYVFAHANFLRNKTIYLTIISLLIIYLFLILYAKYQDRKDVEKLGVTPLADNHQTDEYFYQIIIFTGQRKHSGTKSNVHFMLYGSDDQTSVRTLIDPHREILQRGGIDSFVMSVPKSLGLLNCIRIWHDNTGKNSSASWFLKYLIIRDLQTMEKFYFLSQRWFAVEKDDGQIERVLPVADVIEKSQFSYILSKKAYHSVSDGHLWFSIFSRPPSNQFTRVQRCTCCFVLLFISMFLNLMYYDLQNQTKINPNKSILIFGSIRISFEQIIIGVTVELLSLIPSIFIVQLFRRIRSRQHSISPLRQTLYQIQPTLQKENIMKKKKKTKRSLTFPWWFVFVAYGLCVLLVGMSIFFLIIRGIEFGDVKVQQWLISTVSGFFSSIFLTQPIKILSLAIFFACFCQKPHVDQEANEYLDENELNLGQDEEYLHSNKDKYLFIRRPRLPRNRLNHGEIAAARHRRLKEIQMSSILREIFISVTFLVVLFIITYSNSQQYSYLQVNHLRKYLLNSRQNDLDYTKISTQSDYWKWLKESFIGNIQAQQWYNGDLPRNLSGFMNDKSNRLIGWITMRQLRAKSSFCEIRNLNFSCDDDDYNSRDEETNSFLPGWKNQTNIKSNLTFEQAFEYQSKNELDTYDIQGDYGNYHGGGYVYLFRGRLSDIENNLTQLHQYQWIDDHTRAIIIQLNLYNPNVQLFTSITFLSEFLSTGGILTHSDIQPIQFYAFTSLIQLICLMIYLIFIIYFMFKEIQLFIRLKRKYFLQFWSMIQLGIILCSWIGIGIYSWRYYECSRIGNLFSKTNGYVYINLQLLTYINEILMFIYGFSCFFGTIQLIHLSRFNYRIYFFIQTLQYAGKELISFMVMFLLMFLSFNCLFYLLFISKLSSCSTFVQTSQMLFEMILMKFDAHALSEAAPFLAPFCFSLFIFFGVFMYLSMILSIINENFRQTKDKIGTNDGIYSFIFERFLRYIGWKKQTEAEVYEERDVLMREEYFDPIEHFPEKIDQLLDALNRLYMRQTVN